MSYSSHHVASPASKSLRVAIWFVFSCVVFAFTVACDSNSNEVEIFSVSGTVENTTDRVVRDAQVTLTNAEGSEEFSTITDDGGAYTIEGVVQGEYSLSIIAEGYTTSTTTLAVNADVEAPAQTLRGSAQVRGRVVNAMNGSPIEGAEIFFSFGSNTDPDLADLETLTNADGEYVIQDAPTGVFVCLILADGFGQIVLEDIEFASGRNDLNLVSVSDIPADPGTEPPPPATGSLSPTITLGEIDQANPSRIPLVVGGVSVRRTDAGSGSSLTVVDYTDENLTIVVDDVVQGKLITPRSDGLKADIAFIVDNTSSMANEIAGVRTSVLSFLDALAGSGQDIAAGLVAFGDEMPVGFEPEIPSSDTRAAAAVYDFTDLDNDISASSGLYRVVQELTATDPGTNRDFPELALGGLDFARRTFDWRADAQRIYILVTDDLAWGRGFPIPNRKGIDSNYFTAESLGELVREEGSVIHVYSPGFAPGSVAPPAYDVRTLADETGGIWNELDRSGTFDLTELGIIETTLATSLVEFVRDDDTIRDREVRVHVRFQTNGQVYDGERTVRMSF